MKYIKSYENIKKVPQIGADVNGDSEYLNGKIYTCKVYNRNLTQSEILQNFNATKGRYGL